MANLLSPFLISGAKAQLLLAPSGSLGIEEFTIPNTLPVAIQKIESCLLNLSFTLEQSGAGPQNIPASSTVPVYAYLQYWVPDSTSEFFGKWILDQTEANVVAITSGATPPDTAYNGIDPLLQQACVFNPSKYFYWQIRDYKFKNRKVYRESDLLLLEDAADLLQVPGYFKVGFTYISSDARKILGGGVTDPDITALFDLQNFTCSGIANYTA
jgi:hypothetical protein